jgi:hypothetical protein
MAEGKSAVGEPAMEPAKSTAEPAEAAVESAPVESAPVESAAVEASSTSAVKSLRGGDRRTRKPQSQDGTRDQVSKHGTTSR